MMENTLCKQHPQLPIERLSFKVTQSFTSDVKSLRFDFYKIIIKHHTSYYDSSLCHQQKPALSSPIISFWQNFDPKSHILTQNLLIFWSKKSNVTFMHLQFLKRIQMIIQSCRFFFRLNNIFASRKGNFEPYSRQNCFKTTCFTADIPIQPIYDSTLSTGLGYLLTR